MFRLLYIVRDDILVEVIDGNIITVCHDIVTGLSHLKDDPQVIIIDLGLPNNTGLEGLKIIRANPFNHQIKIIVCSRHFNLGLIKKAFEMGADFYLTIPLDSEQIKFVLLDIKKSMKYLPFTKAFQYINYERKSLQNDNSEV